MTRLFSLRVPAILLAVGLAMSACGGGASSHVPPTAPDTPELVDVGHSEIPAADGYAGSSTCRACHTELFDRWAGTLHNLYTRKTDRRGATGRTVVADANRNRTDDFRDGLDLSGDPDFAAFGANAPKLAYSAGEEYPYQVRIWAATYDVWRTIGGNGLWMQRYLTRIGRSVYVLPIQYNEKTEDWVPYDADTFYVAQSAPRFASATAARGGIDRGASFDLNCAGCHATGFRLGYDATEKEYLSGYREVSVGCESCHGPALAHVNSAGDPSLVLNPADLLDGTAAGVKAADMICARCHLRGEGADAVAGRKPGYPLRGDGTFPPGRTDLASYVSLSANPGDYWRYKDNPMGFSPTAGDPSDDTFLASRSHHQQWNDLGNGPHTPDQSYDSNCFECHDPHGSSQEAQLRADLPHRGVTYTGVDADSNKLCIACHHGHGDFAGITDADVQAIEGSNAPTVVVDAVVGHMKDRAAMPVAASAYDPEGTGTGRCTGCHMVKTMKSAVFTTDREGQHVGDLHSHTFWPVWPHASDLATPKVTNSCNGCHPLGPSDKAGDIIGQWREDPDTDGTFHADDPSNFQNGVANAQHLGGVACVACHTTAGFLAIQVEDGDIHHLADAGSQDARTAIVKSAIAHDEGITCQACHGKGPGGAFAAGPNPLRFPPEDLCGKCHMNETVRFIDYRDHGEIVRHPQQQMFSGVEGGEVPGGTYTNSPHTKFVGKACVGCHYNPLAGGTHGFEPNVAQCRTCHPGLPSMDRPSAKDWDGDGQIEGIQTEFDGSLARLEAAILAATPSTGAAITFDGEYWLIDGDRSDTAALNATNDEALLRAMFNHYWVRFDGSRGVHNPRYALQLIQQSYEELTGTPWPGAKR